MTSPSRKRRYARLVLLVLAAGLFFLFPGLKRSEIEFRYRIDAPACVERVELRLFENGVLARGHRQLVEGRDFLTHSAKLRHRSYDAVVIAECRDGSNAVASRQPIIVEQDVVIHFKVSGAECRCSDG